MQSHDPQSLVEWRESVRAKALDLGFSAAGFTTSEPIEGAVQRRWARWFGLNRAGSMRYLLRRTPRRTHPCDLLPEARSLIMVAASYHDGDHSDPPDEPHGRIARYAWGRDYHGVIRDRLDSLGEWIAAHAGGRGHAGPVVWRAAADSAPLDERAFAVRAGLGFIGKNTLLLHPGRGSWMLLGALLISIPFPADECSGGDMGQLDGSESSGGVFSCGACRKCIDACPTSALVGPYELDATKCISYLTIEQRDPIPSHLQERLSGWAFGCDICQEVCPVNTDPARLRLPELARTEGSGPWLTWSLLDSISSGKAFIRRWGHTPLARPGLRLLKRNLSAMCAGKGMSTKENTPNDPME